VSAPLLSIVAPVYNEGAGVDAFVARLTEILTGQDLRWEFVLVDDGSTDDSWARVAALSAVDARVRGVQLSRNFGKEAAVLAGLEHAGGDAVVVIDADLQHPPSVIPTMVQCWRDGADVVEAVKRDRTGQPLANKVASRLFNRVFTGLTKVDLVNATDFRLLGRNAVDALLRMPEHSSFFRGTSSWIGFRRAAVEITIDPRSGGETRWTARALFRLAVNGLTSFTSAPLHLVTLGGLTFAGFAVLLGIQTLARWVRGDSVAGFTTVILLLLVLGTFVMLGLGIIGEYLARVHEEVRGRPRFLVRARTGADERPRWEALDRLPGQWPADRQRVVEQRVDTAER
jgi:glycosyltransferase involved in cell wall biosynthesis